MIKSYSSKSKDNEWKISLINIKFLLKNKTSCSKRIIQVSKVIRLPVPRKFIRKKRIVRNEREEDKKSY